MECVVVQDLFLNETAKYAHVFLPGSSFLEKDGTFTNAERRISRVRKVMEPLRRLAGLGSHACGSRTRSAIRCTTTHPSRDHGRDRALTPTFAGVTYEKLDRLGSIQWPCNDAAPEGTPTMHVGEFVRGKGKFFVTEYVPTQRAHDARYPLLLTTGRMLTQYNVGRADASHGERRLARRGSARDPSARRRVRGIANGDWVGLASRAGEIVLRAAVTDRVRPGVVYTTFHFPESGANVVTTENSDWATNCPEYKVTAVEVVKVNQPSEWQQRFREMTAPAQAQAERRCRATPEPTAGDQLAGRVLRWRDGRTEACDDRRRRGSCRCSSPTTGIPHVVMLATPADLEDLGVGFTLSEGIVARRRRDPLGRAAASPAGTIEVRIDIAAERFSEVLKRQRNLTGRTGCGVCGAETIEQAIRRPPPSRRRQQRVPVAELASRP